MPFQSEKQRRYLWANEPEIARDWTDTYGSRIEKDEGGIARLGFKKGSSRQPGMNVHTQAQKNQQTRDVQNLQAQMRGQGSGSDASDYVKMQQHLEDPRRHDPPEIKKTLGDKHRDWRAEQEKKSYKKLMLSKMKGSPFTLPSMFSALKGPVSDEDFEEEYGVSYEDFKTMNPMQMEAILGSVKGAKHATGLEKISLADRDDIRRLSGGINEGGNWEDIFYGPKGPSVLGGGDGGYRGYRNYEEWLAAQNRNTGGVTEVAEVIEEEPISDFQKSIAGGPQLQYEDYGTAAHGRRHNVDERMFSANGGRIPAAYGGIMDSSTGRRAYGLGSIFKSIGKAAKKVLKSPIGKAAVMYGLGTYLGGMGAFGGATGTGATPWYARWKDPKLLGNLFKPEGWSQGNILNPFLRKYDKDFEEYGKFNPWKVGLAGATALPFLMGGPKEEDEDEAFDYDAAKQAYADEIMRIKAGAMAGTLDPNKFSYLGVKDGGRIGLYAGGQSTPSDYTMEDAMMTTTQDKLGGITDVMKQADLHRQGSVGQFYAAHGGSADDKLMARIKELQDEGLDYNSARAQAEKEAQGKAQGGRIGYAHGGAGYPPVTMGQVPQAPQAPAPPQRPHPMPAPQPNRMAGMNPMMNPMGGRRMAQEGGLMDLGGMEKDYRQEGGFVPLGGEEKADDVPARLSKNEFVFTADAVRGAGGGDIDQGAEVMENVMKNLEQGGQVSEETQGLTGAQEMFGVSERLSEVV